MILACKTYITEVLNSIGIATVYSNSEDESRHKGLSYGMILGGDDPDQMTYDGSKVGITNDYDQNIRTYHIRSYKIVNVLEIRIAAKSETEAGKLKNDFLKNLGTVFDDGYGYGIEVVAESAVFISDKNIIKIGAGYRIQLIFTGGVYKTKGAPLISTIEPQGEIIKEV